MAQDTKMDLTEMLRNKPWNSILNKKEEPSSAPGTIHDAIYEFLKEKNPYAKPPQKIQSEMPSYSTIETDLPDDYF